MFIFVLVNNKIIKMNKHKIKNYIVNIVQIVIVAVLLWVTISTMIQGFKCPQITGTQLFLHIPKSFVCDWQYCN